MNGQGTKSNGTGNRTGENRPQNTSPSKPLSVGAVLSARDADRLFIQAQNTIEESKRLMIEHRELLGRIKGLANAREALCRDYR